MNNDQWKRLTDLVPDTLALPADQRDPFLDRNCRKADGTRDTELQKMVLAMVDASDVADSVGAIVPPLAGLAGNVAAAQSLRPSNLPDRIGPWKPIRKLGAGGMGIVYAAERSDDSFSQFAAVKVVRDGHAEDFQVRFVRERAILASLNHNGIARLLDGGVTQDGSNYIALELVDGVSITSFANSRSLGVAERISLFLDACDAVAYAHRNLVVHRDLKPSNIMVDTSGESPAVKLVDFGIAKLLADEDHHSTRTGLGPMTPEYAAPEQLLLQPITTATDVYSLGVVLFELLTGERPYAIGSLTASEAERVVANAALPLPSSVTSDHRRSSVLRGDLDQIVLKSLAKEPERRYESAAALAEDLRRYIDGWPVHAKPDSVTYRLSRYLFRHRTAVAVGVLVLVLISSIAAIFGVRVAQERNRATEAAAAAQAEALRSEAIAGFLERILRAPSTRWYVPGEAKGPDTPVRAVLDEAARQLETEFEESPELRADLHHIMGDTYLGLGMLDESEYHNGEALRLRKLFFQEPHPKIAEAYYYLAINYYARGDMVRRVQLLRQAYEMLQESPSGNNLPFIAEELAAVERDFGSVEVAESLFNEARMFVERQFVDGTSGFSYRSRILASIASGLAMTNARKGQSELVASWVAFADSVASHASLAGNTAIAPGGGALDCALGIQALHAEKFAVAEGSLLRCSEFQSLAFSQTTLPLQSDADLHDLYSRWNKPEKSRRFAAGAVRYRTYSDSVRMRIARPETGSSAPSK